MNSSIRLRIVPNAPFHPYLMIINLKDYTQGDTKPLYHLIFHFQNWHCHGKYLPLPEMTSKEFDTYIDHAAPYMARLLGILKHSPAEINILTDQKGTALRQKLEDVRYHMT